MLAAKPKLAFTEETAFAGNEYAIMVSCALMLDNITNNEIKNKTLFINKNLMVNEVQK
jgi:hypothetical protein